MALDVDKWIVRIGGVLGIVVVLFGAFGGFRGWVEHIAKDVSRQQIEDSRKELGDRFSRFEDKLDSVSQRLARIEGKLNVTTRAIKSAETQYAAAVGKGHAIAGGTIKKVNLPSRLITLETLSGEFVSFTMAKESKFEIVEGAARKATTLDSVLNSKPGTPAVFIWNVHSKSTNPVVDVIGLIRSESGAM